MEIEKENLNNDLNLDGKSKIDKESLEIEGLECTYSTYFYI